MDTRLFFTLPALVLWASCRKDEPALPLPRYPVCEDVTIQDPSSPYVIAIGSAFPETTFWMDTDGQPGVLGQDNLQIGVSKTDINPGPGVDYEYIIGLYAWPTDSIGFMTDPNSICYGWYMPGDTLWPDAQLSLYSYLHYSTNTYNPDCAPIESTRFIGFARLVDGARRCGYLRAVPFDDLNPLSHYSLRFDQVRMASCDWSAVVLPTE